MRKEDGEELCARLCLLTRACWSEALPAPFSRPAFYRMAASGAVQSLVLRGAPGIAPGMYARAEALLSRVRAVAELTGRYGRRGYRALLPEREGWPEALHALGEQMPPFLFARGELFILEGERFAVAGSREIRHGTAQAARRLGRRIAEEGAVLVTGGARGVDTAAQAGALEAGGRVVLVPARSEESVLGSAATARALEAGRLLLLYDSLPDEPFSAPRALARNHTIYALGRSPVLVCCDETNADMAGCRALLALGARTLDADRPLRAQAGCEQLRLC